MLKFLPKNLLTSSLNYIKIIAVFFPLVLTNATNASQGKNQPKFSPLETQGGEITKQQIAQNSLGQIFATVEAKLVQIIRKGDGNTPIAFDMGTNFPMRAGQMPDGGQLMKPGYEIVGYVDASRKRQPFTPNELKRTADEARARQNSGFQSQGIPVLDIIVREKRTGVFYEFRNVNAFAVRRDAINAVYTGNLRRFKP